MYQGACSVEQLPRASWKARSFMSLVENFHPQKSSAKAAPSL
jgi:hypothetical protein